MMSCMKWLKEGDVFDNNSEVTLEELNDYAMSRNLGGLIFVGLLMFFGLFGNIIVIIIYSCKVKASNNYTVYILCLGVLDLTNCCLTMPFIIVYLMYPLKFPSPELCKAGHFVAYWIGIGSPFLLVLIAADRYRRICQPFRKQLSERNARICCGIALLASLVFALPSPFLYGSEAVDTGILNITGVRCFQDENKDLETLQKSYYMLLSTLSTIVSVSLLILYYLIMKKVKTQTMYWENSKSGSQRDGRKAKESRKTTWTFFVVTTVYVLSTLPHDALALLLHLKEDLECDLGFSFGAVFYTFLFTVFINNVANPIIYGFSDDRFYVELKNIFRKNDAITGRTRISSQQSAWSIGTSRDRNSSESSLWRTKNTLDPVVSLCPSI